MRQRNWKIMVVKKTGLIGCLLILCMLASIAAPLIHIGLTTRTTLANDVWQIQTVDSAGDTGRFSSLAFDINGNPAISYHGDWLLRFAYWNGSSWVSFATPTITTQGWYEYPIGSVVETTKFNCNSLNDMGEYSEIYEFMYNLLDSARPKIKSSLAGGKRGLIL